MIAFIDDHREAYGVEPICKVLPIALSTYRAHVAKRADAARLSARARRDAPRDARHVDLLMSEFGDEASRHPCERRRSIRERRRRRAADAGYVKDDGGPTGQCM